MKHLLSGSLPGCETIEQAEENHRINAMEMALRESRIMDTEDWNLKGSPEEADRLIEKYLLVAQLFNELRAIDEDIYKTYIYVKSRLGMVFSHLRDEQLRNALHGTSLALNVLYGDRDVIRPTIQEYRDRKYSATHSMLQVIRERVTALLPRMESIVSEHAKKDIAVIPRTPLKVTDEETCEVSILEDVLRGGRHAQESCPEPIALAAIRLRMLVYLRHPIDLMREIANWLTDMENSE